MAATRALLGPMSGGMGRQGLERLLTEAIDIETAHEYDWDGVVARLTAESFNVLIAELGADDAPSMDVLHGLQDDLAVIAVDLGKPDTVVHVRNTGGDLFIALVRVCGGVKPQKSPAQAPVIEFRPPSRSSSGWTPSRPNAGWPMSTLAPALVFAGVAPTETRAVPGAGAGEGSLAGSDRALTVSYVTRPVLSGNRIYRTDRDGNLAGLGVESGTAREWGKVKGRAGRGCPVTAGGNGSRTEAP